MSDLLVQGPPAIRVITAGDGRLKTATQCAPSAGKKQGSQKHVAFQPLVRIIRDTGNLILSWRDGLNESERQDKTRAEERMQILAARMQNVGLRIAVSVSVLSLVLDFV
jgi:TAG lipase / steryl ester hydrolase / phospholipase A2 / LPA acyltransferase